MNFKCSILTICLTASAFLAPQKAFGVEHQSHKEVQYVCVRETKDSLSCQVESNEHEYLAVQKAKEIESSKSSLSANTNRGSVALNNQYSYTSTHEVLLITVIWASTVIFWVFLYNKQRKNRLAAMRQNIEALERLWGR